MTASTVTAPLSSLTGEIELTQVFCQPTENDIVWEVGVNYSFGKRDLAERGVPRGSNPI